MFYFSSLRFFSLCKASSDLMRAEKAKYHILVNKVTNCMFFEIESRICFLCLKVSPGKYLRWTRSSRKWLHAVANANRIIIITFDIFITTFQQPSIPLSFTPRLSLSFFLRTTGLYPQSGGIMRTAEDNTRCWEHVGNPRGCALCFVWKCMKKSEAQVRTVCISALR